MRHEDIQHAAVQDLQRALAAGQDPFPIVVEVHPSARCNQRCAYCFQADCSSVAVEESLLTPAAYGRLFTELAALKIRQVSVSGGGEPFLYSGIAEILASAHAAGLELRIVTNGSAIPEEAFAAILKTCEIRVSLDAIRAETYQKLRGVPGLVLDRVLRNIRRLVLQKKTTNSSLTIGVSFLVADENFVELPEFCCRVLEDLEVEKVIVKYDIVNFDRLGVRNRPGFERVLRGLNDPRIEIRPYEMAAPFGSGCFMPFFKVAVNPHGEVFSCCLAAQPGPSDGFRLGSLRQGSFSAVWSSSKGLRDRLRKEGVTCRSCNYTDFLLNQQMTRVSSGLKAA